MFGGVAGSIGGFQYPKHFLGNLIEKETICIRNIYWICCILRKTQSLRGIDQKSNWLFFKIVPGKNCWHSCLIKLKQFFGLETLVLFFWIVVFSPFWGKWLIFSYWSVLSLQSRSRTLSCLFRMSSLPTVCLWWCHTVLSRFWIFPVFCWGLPSFSVVFGWRSVGWKAGRDRRLRGLTRYPHWERMMNVNNVWIDLHDVNLRCVQVSCNYCLHSRNIIHKYWKFRGIYC